MSEGMLQNIMSLNQIYLVSLTSLYSEVCQSYSQRGQSFYSTVRLLKMDDSLSFHPNNADWPTCAE